MNRGKEPLVSLCEREFVLQAIKDSKRLDGRGPYDYRTLGLTASPHQPGSVEVTLGNTRVLANVSCEVVRPRPQRPTEGDLFFNVELSPMASPAFEVGRSSPLATEVARMLERCLKDSRAVDTESLCIIAGEKVWSLRVDIHVLDQCGNITDCATVAAIAALKHFRRPDVTVIGEEATIHPVTERDPVPLSVHHMPFSVSFAFFSDGGYLLVDPNLTEETVMEGRLVIGMNVHREICVLGMAGGFALLPDQLLRCVKIATVKCQEFTEAVQNTLTTTSTTAAKSEPGGSSSILETRRGVKEVRVVRSETGEGGEGQVKVVDEEEEEEEEEEEGEGDVVYLGEGTAQVGLGGRSQWTLDTEEGRDDKEDTRDDVIIIDDEEEGVSEKAEVVGSSSEEEVVVLTPADIGGFTKPEPSPTREGEGGRRGRRGGRTTPRGPGAMETSVERGRGRQNKRKKNKKKQQN